MFYGNLANYKTDWNGIYAFHDEFYGLIGYATRDCTTPEHFTLYYENFRTIGSTYHHAMKIAMKKAIRKEENRVGIHSMNFTELPMPERMYLNVTLAKY